MIVLAPDVIEDKWVVKRAFERWFVFGESERNLLTNRVVK
jgi:hypothetical protein